MCQPTCDLSTGTWSGPAQGRDFSRLLPGLPPREYLPFGALVGLVDVVDCVPLDRVRDQPHAEGPWCWIVRDPRPIVPVAWSGTLSLFDVPDHLIHLSDAQPIGRTVGE